MAVDKKKLRLLLKDCANGFYQQMYFFGKDVLHPRGNQLKARGFKKSPSQGLKGTSCYTLEDSDQTIVLYGSCAGLYSKDSRVVFLRKRERFYRWLPEEHLIAGCWTQEDIETADPEEMLQELTPLLRWWVDYEEWIEENLGSQYREFCHGEWKKLKSKASWLPPQQAVAWVREFIELGDQHVRPKQYEEKISA